MKRLNRIFLTVAISILALCSVSICAEPSGELRNSILIGWDGAGRERVVELLSSGQLPNLKQLITEGAFVNIEVTTGKTETKPGWTEILTGYNSERLEIYSNKKYRPIPQGHTIFERLKQHFGAQAIVTIFIGGKINNIGSRGPHEICINCFGRDSVTHQKTMWWDRSSCSADTVDGKVKHWVFREGEPFFYSRKAIDFHQIGLGAGRNVIKKVLMVLNRYKHKAFFAFFHFEEPDEQGHIYGESSPEYIQAIKDADSYLGRIVKKLKTLGIYGKTSIYVTADHGFDKGKLEHRYAPSIFLATNSKRKMVDGDRKDITPTILKQYGIDLNSISPKLDGQSLLTDNNN